MPPFNMVVGAWPLEVEVVPLVTLELPVHQCGVKVRHQLIHVRDLRCLLFDLVRVDLMRVDFERVDLEG